MPVTTVLSEGPSGATIVSESEPPRRFSWSAAFAGAFVAIAVTLFLLTLGSGVGLSLVTVQRATGSGETTFLTLGAIYFLAAQAFGFAAGGHVAGRLIGPALETGREEEIRAGMHGLVAWALAVVATAALVAFSVLAVGSGPAGSVLAATTVGGARDGNAAATTSYWVDTLFRAPAGIAHASLVGRQYAQLDNGTANDGTTTPPNETTGGESTVAPTRETTFLPAGAGPVSTAPVTTTQLPPVPPAQAAPTIRTIGADKAEAGRILTFGMAKGAHLTSDDHTQLARLIAQDAGITLGAAQQRVTQVEARMHRDDDAAAETARKTAAYASLWTALALLFGAVVAVFATISARWEDDREAGLLPQTPLSAVRF